MAVPLIAAIGAALLANSVVNAAMNLYPPLWNHWQKFTMSTWPNVNPQVSDMIEMYYKGLMTESEYLTRCSEFGYDEDVAKLLLLASKTMLSTADYINLWRRGELAETELNTLLLGLHILPDEIERAKQATVFYPSPQDMIRFAVREVYTPDIVNKFGMMEDLPDVFLQEARTVGVQEKTAKEYWAAHWELPSAQMGFAMLHRRIIDDDTLKLLLRSLDVMPFWRDALIKLSYNPLTRVDVRRMHSMGVLEEEEVKNAYLDRGYSPENAQRMMEFTVAFNSDELSGVSRSNVINAYKKGIITREQLKKFLTDFGLTEQIVNFWLSMADYDMEMETIDSIVDELNAQYVMGKITIPQVRAKLAGMDVPAIFISTVISKLELRQSSKIKLPSKSDLIGWLANQLIDDGMFTARMRQLGYDNTDIEMYLAEIDLKGDVSEIKYLAQKTYDRWFTNGIIDEARYRTVMVGRGITTIDIDTKVIELKSKQAQ